MKNEFSFKELIVFGFIHLICFLHNLYYEDFFKSFTQVCFTCNILSFFILAFRVYLLKYFSNFVEIRRLIRMRTFTLLLIFMYLFVFIFCVFFNNYMPFYPFYILLNIGVFIHFIYIANVIKEFMVIKNEKPIRHLDELHEN